MIYVTSDLHFGHDRPFIYGARGFNSIKEHDEAIVNIWNSIVNDDDEIYVLGDIMLGQDKEYGINLWNQLKGQKHIIWGNHDSVSRQYLLERCKNTIVEGYSTMLKYRKYSFYLSHYPSLTANYDINYPLKQRIINICGHTHTTDPFDDFYKGLIYHVELDAHDMNLVPIDQIIEDIKAEYALIKEN